MKVKSLLFLYFMRLSLCLSAFTCTCHCVLRFLLHPDDLLTPLVSPVNRSNYPKISFNCSPGILAKKLHFTSRAADLSWQDIIGLQSSFHRKFNTWHTSAWVGQACRWRRNWSCVPLLPIVICGICKGHLQEALDMTSSGSIYIPWLLCGLNITDAFQTTGAVGHFSGKTVKVTHTISAIALILFLCCPHPLLQGRRPLAV